MLEIPYTYITPQLYLSINLLYDKGHNSKVLGVNLSLERVLVDKTSFGKYYSKISLIES